MARRGDAERIVALLHEAAAWLCEQGMPMWHPDEIAFDVISNDVQAGLFFVAIDAGKIIAAVKFELHDNLFWPDVAPGESAFLHRFVVCRTYAGRGISTVILRWAVERAVSLNKSYVRLDCEVSRPRLRSVYESFGFRHRDDRQVERFFVSRYEYDITRAGRTSKDFIKDS